MTIDEANALHAYIIDLWWKAYQERQVEPNAGGPSPGQNKKIAAGEIIPTRLGEKHVS